MDTTDPRNPYHDPWWARMAAWRPATTLTGIRSTEEPTMNTLHIDFARQVADDRLASRRIGRRGGAGSGRHLLAALLHRARPAAAAQPGPAHASA